MEPRRGDTSDLRGAPFWGRAPGLACRRILAASSSGGGITADQTAARPVQVSRPASLHCCRCPPACSRLGHVPGHWPYRRAGYVPAMVDNEARTVNVNEVQCPLRTPTIAARRLSAAALCLRLSVSWKI